MAAERYTQVERPTMWLVPEGEQVDPFYVSRTLVTNRQYEEFDPRHERSALTPEDDAPVVNVGLEQARAYCAWYAALAGKPFRLPTDAEWLHACTAGRPGRFFWGDDPSRGDAHVIDAATFDGSLRLESRRANPFGLHDLLGTVWEWTASGTLRGGSFRTPRTQLSCAIALSLTPAGARDDAGFRIVRTLRTGVQSGSGGNRPRHER